MSDQRKAPPAEDLAGLQERVEAALRALDGRPAAGRNAALLGDPADAREIIRDIVAEELARYWERRYGRTP